MIPIRDDQPSFSTPFINYFLITANMLVFLWEVSISYQSPRALDAIMFQLGLIPRHEIAVLSGTTYSSPLAAVVTIFTSMFLHGSWGHIFFNMLWLWIFGDNVEDYLGHFRYLLFYLASGVAGAITHIVLNASSRTPTVGASGAIAGVIGAYFILYPRARVLTWFPPIFFFHVPAWLILGYWFLGQFLSGAVTSIAETTQATGGVAFWAHVGGFVAGVVMIKLLPERPHRYRYGTW